MDSYIAKVPSQKMHVTLTYLIKLPDKDGQEPTGEAEEQPNNLGYVLDKEFEEWLSSCTGKWKIYCPRKWKINAGWEIEFENQEDYVRYCMFWM